jgi:2-keto-4-pentenoate hydratase/2-oxohepta-3-ene-1,7-dioic acid hydratase in catechol pathway
MKFCSFVHQGRASWGMPTEQGIVDLAGRTGFATLRGAIAAGELLEISQKFRGEAGVAVDDITYAIPIPDAEKIICVGVNYPDRNAEYKDGQDAPPFPSLFLRTARSFVGHGQPILRPPESVQFDYEGEVVLIIGKGGRRIPQDQALAHIAGLSLANEGTVRDWVRHAKFNVTQGKNWDASGAIGPDMWVYHGQTGLDLETRVNGEARQRDNTDRMIFDFAYIISYVSTFTTLAPGDMILTGTPTGAGARFDPPKWLVPGDVIEVSATGLGTLHNVVRDE